MQARLGGGIAATLLVLTGPTLAQTPPTAAEAVERLFEAPDVAALFTPEFLTAIPATELQALIASMEAAFGEPVRVTGEGDRVLVEFAEATVPAEVALDGEGLFAGLLFGEPVPVGDISDHVAALAALPGETSVLVVTDGAVAAGHQADVPLAVGSTAKLAILRALTDAVAEGRLALDDVVPLDAASRTAGSGTLLDWPDGTPVTVATLAGFMISVSDNRATDALVRLLGADAVSAVSPRNTPFPTTRELFAVKADPALLEAWTAGDSDARRGILADLAPDAPLAPVATVTLGAEWLLTAGELCALMDGLAGEPLLSINPGLADPGDWQEVAFKGGSEPGVLNYTTRLVGEDGRAHCVSATWNDDAPLDEAAFHAGYRGILLALARR